MFLAIAIWVPRGLALDSFVSTDEIAWFVRSANFYYAIGQRDWDGTMQNFTPGVTTMWVNTFAFLLEHPEYRGWGQGQFDSFLTFEKFTDSHGIDPHVILTTGRAIMVGINTILLILCFYLARQLMGFTPALCGILLMAFEPYIIGLTRLSHLDGLVGTLSIVSLFAFMVYAFKENKLFYLISAAVGVGASGLTKITGFIIFPVIGVALVIMIILRRNGKLPETHLTFIQWLRKISGHMIVFAVVFVLTNILLWPFLWRNPGGKLMELFRTPMQFLPVPSETQSEEIAEDMSSTQRTFKSFMRYPYHFLWRVSPISLAGLGLAIYFFIRGKDIFHVPKIRWVVWILVVSVITYLIFLTIPVKSNFRYWVPGYLSVLMIAGTGWLVLVNTISKKISGNLRNAFLILVITGLCMIQFNGIVRTFPYYFTYYNPLLGGGKQATKNIMVGEGEGLDQAGHYLSSLPNSANTTAMSWYGWGCFSFYFSGKTIIFPVTRNWGPGLAEKLQQSDYLVTYANQWYRRIPPELYDSLEEVEPMKQIWVDGIEYVRIYEVTSLPPEVFNPE